MFMLIRKTFRYIIILHIRCNEKIYSEIERAISIVFLFKCGNAETPVTTISSEEPAPGVHHLVHRSVQTDSVD